MPGPEAALQNMPSAQRPPAPRGPSLRAATCGEVQTRVGRPPASLPPAPPSSPPSPAPLRGLVPQSRGRGACRWGRSFLCGGWSSGAPASSLHTKDAASTRRAEKGKGVPKFSILTHGDERELNKNHMDFETITVRDRNGRARQTLVLKASCSGH